MWDAKMWKQVKSLTKKQVGGAVSYIEILNEDGTRTKISDKGPMLEKITEANTAKLVQAHRKVPLCMEPLQSYFGEQGDVEKWKAIHRGELKIPEGVEVDKGFRLFFNAITSNHLPRINMIYDDKEYNASWKKMKERTSSAPPTHFGHYRSPIPGSPASIVNTIIGTLPFATGYTPNRWKECVNTMLIKKINDLRPDKLRLITLLEPQYLQGSKISNKKMMENAERYYALAPEQYGSRKRKSSRSHCLNKRLVFDLNRIEHAIMVLIANDLKSCYDRILMIIAFLVLTHLGISEEAAIVLTVIMMEMKHRIRTKYGDSDDYYGGDKWKEGGKPHGNGQGNGNGPGLWNGISSICLDIMRKQGFGMDMISPMTSTAIMLTGFAFVDDTDLIQQGINATDALNKAQNGLILWEELMRASGGALEPSKSDWVMVNYQHRKGKWRLEPKRENRTLEVKGPDGEVTPLTQLNPKDARETLGVWQSPTGDETTQVEKLKEAVNKWCSGIQSKFLPSNYVEQAIRCTIGRKIHYCLLATCLSEEQCNEIIDPIVRRVMPRMKMPRNTFRRVVFAPTSLLGVGIDHPFIAQLVEHVKEISDVGGTSKHTGSIISNILEHHQLECGISGQIFEWNISKIASLMTPTWLKFTLIHMHEYNIDIKSDHAELKMWRENDTLIMDEAIRRHHGAGGYPWSRVEAINRCRKFLHVVNISDITNGFGTHLTKAAYECTQPLYCTSSRAYKWARQAKPTTNDISIWQSFLNDLSSRNRKLVHPLGEWEEEASIWHEWRYDQDLNRLYERGANGWKVWIVNNNSRRTRRLTFTPTSMIEEPSEIENTSIAAVYKTSILSRLVKLNGFAPIKEPQITECKTLQEELLNNGWAIPKITIINEERIVEMIRNGTAKGISDGSCKDLKSTSGFQFFDDDDDELLEGGNFIPGSSSDHTSYQSELGGLLGLAITVYVICKKHRITSGAVTLGCDNDSALDAFFWDDSAMCTNNSYDIIRMLHYYRKNTPVTWHKKKVQGHQDKNTKYDDLDMWGKANVRADKLAKQFMDSHPTHITNKNPKGAGWIVHINGEPIRCNISRAIYTYCTGPAIKRYWAEKSYIDTAEYNDEMLDECIHWKGIEKFSSMIPSTKRIWITKHMAHISATNHVMGPNFRKERDTDKCPMCDCVEHADHVYVCKSDIASSTFHEHLAELRKWLDKHSPWDLRNALVEILLAVRDERDVIIDQNWSESVKDATNAQVAMSSKALTNGLIHISWIEIQTAWLRRTQSKMTPDTWSAYIINFIWNITCSMWRQRCNYLHNNEEGRRKILAANIDSDIDELYRTMPPNTWMTKGQKAVLLKPKETVKKWKSRRKIRWYRQAKIMIKSHIKFLETSQASASATRLRTFLNYNPHPHTTHQYIERPPPPPRRRTIQQDISNFAHRRQTQDKINLAQVNMDDQNSQPAHTSKQRRITEWIPSIT